MKTFRKFLAAVVTLTIFCTTISTKVKAQEVTFQVFYDDLSPYGQWVEYSSYGYVWVPAAGPGFVPYSSGGHWVWTDYGWTWVSDYSWGWAPFHYGRWDYDPYYGWVWIPDNVWGPAWVSWRHGDGVYGWAPMGPGITVGVAIGGYNPPADHWVFVNEHYMGRHDIHNYYGPRKNNATYINNSTVINNTYVDNSTHNTYVSGPRREDVQKATGREIKPVAIKESAKPGQKESGSQLNIYRPHVERGAATAKPAKVATKQEVKPISERPVMTKSKTPASDNSATTPANNRSSKAPAGRQPATQQRKEAPAQKQPLNSRPATRKAPAQQPKQQQPAKQQPVQRQRPAQQPKQQPAPQPQHQPVVPHQQPVPQRQPAPQQRQQAPAPVPHPAPAPRPAPQPNRPH